MDSGAGGGGDQRGGARQMLFDRVLCDPPCSQDGALREAPERWAEWTVGLALEHHPRQLKLLLRGLHLLQTSRGGQGAGGGKTGG